ncbi:hypothetical protein BJ878DRAFT_25816 [Calycina marina]|uniref:NACHT-NTPase and P-loop NTPases N-terminal domain-containing protein n=1 Tax=Calycina marina TaxID=1763456 RepID=A0A9P8CAS2_9HELO|nr:hypothetical protein BJ878DRAFT_25816 [Calycina marina]
MSDAEAGFVTGLIGSLMSIIDEAKNIYDAARHAKGQPEAFRQVAARLPLVIEILRSAKERASSLDNEEALAAIEETLEACKMKAENLKKIFYNAIRKEDDKWLDRYKKAVKTWTKGDTVEGLMEGILKDTQLLACEHLMGVATEAQVKELDEGIKEMKEMPLSLQEETGSVTQNHDGSGNNNANTGRGAMHTGNGDLYHNEIKGDAHFGSNPGEQVINYYNLPRTRHPVPEVSQGLTDN